MKQMSDKQSQIFYFIKRYLNENGYAPSIREIGDDVNLASPSTVKYHLAFLEENGYIRRKPAASRAIKILKD